MDRTLVLMLNALAVDTPRLGMVAAAVAQYGILLYAGLMLTLWWRAPDLRRRTLVLAVAAAVIALAANAILSHVAPRPRPYLVLPVRVLQTPAPRDASFPSDHAAVTAALAMSLLLGGFGAIGSAGLVGALLIGTSRVMAGLHYPTDIMGGMLVGVSSAFVLTRAQEPLGPILDAAIAAARRVGLA